MSEKKEDIIEGPGFTIIDRRIGAKKSQDKSTSDAEGSKTAKTRDTSSITKIS